jgi:GNAT superfamily N-acetyltransferase
MSIQIETLDAGWLDEAAVRFIHHYKRLRRTLRVLPSTLEDHAAVTDRLRNMTGRSLAAISDGRLVGYMAWWVVDRFRGSGRLGAYVPEWAHCASPGHKAAVYGALYRAAATIWTEAGCGVHAITLLADDEEAREVWSWNGFGLAVVDAVRETAPLAGATTDLAVRQATVKDAALLSELDAEHVVHYTAAPIYMAPPKGDSSSLFEEFIARPKNSVWLALDDAVPAGFMRFTGYDFDAVAALESDSAAFCNGAYVRPAFRGRGAGKVMLQAALAHYASLGLGALYTNFESFNPEAASFWPRYFTPACLSMMRVPEVLPEVSAAGRIRA